MNKKTMIILTLIGLCIIIGIVVSNSSLLSASKDTSSSPLTIKAEDFSIFLFESAEEIYRANVKDRTMWAGLRENAISDMEYDQHYSWLYDTYAAWDEQRRAQLNAIMTGRDTHEMIEFLIQSEKQAAGLNEIIKFMREERYFRDQRELLIDFYSWYGANYAQPHYQQIKPILQRRADKINSMVETNFDIIAFMEKETGIRNKKKLQNLELQLNMRIIGMSVFSRKKDTITTVQWDKTPIKIWTAVFNEFSSPFFDTFINSWSFKNTLRKLKKDEALMQRYKEDIPYTWEGWIGENLTEGFAKYMIYRKGMAKDPVGEGTYVFDKEYAQVLASSFDPQKISLKDFTSDYLKKTYDI